MIKRILTKYTFAIACVSSALSLQAQDDADKMFVKSNFDEAYNLYSAYPIEKLSSEQIYKMAVSVLNGSSYSKKAAVELLEKFLEKNPNDGNAHYLYGRALAFEQRFDDAEKEFTICLTSTSITPTNKADAGHELDYCQDARVLLPYKIDVTIDNLGQDLNSVFKDYYPFTNGEESILYFNSRRNDGSIEKENGDFTANIFYSTVVDGKFSEAKPLEGNVNDPEFDEEIVGLSVDGSKGILSLTDKAGNSSLKIANLKNGKVISYEKLPKAMRSGKYHEIAATFGLTTNEIYFASDRPGGFGGIDIYVIRKSPTGKWAVPQNLGPEINTLYDEDFPNLSHDGKALFFSSKGHASIGGYDIFKAVWDENVLRFVKPTNVGFPVNTLFDDMNLNFSSNGRYGYVSRLTEKNSNDICRVTFEEVEEQLSIITGFVDAKKKEGEMLSGLIMIVEDMRNGDIVGEYLPNPATMHYVMALKPGVYKVTIHIDEFEPLEQKIEIADKSSFNPQLVIDYKLKRN